MKMTFAESLRRFRKERNLTQKNVAEAVGTDVSVYQRYERGTAYPSVMVVMKIADAFNVPLDYLVGRDESRDESEVYLLNDFRELNPEGRRSLIDYAEFLRLKHRSEVIPHSRAVAAV